MADPTNPLADLLGIDPAQLKGLLAQFEPSAADKQQAVAQGLMAAGLGILAHNNQRNPFAAIGSGGLLGQQQYNQELARLGQQRQQTLQQGLSLIPLARQLQWQKVTAGVNPQGSSTQVGSPSMPGASAADLSGASPADRAAMGMGGGSAAMFSNPPLPSTSSPKTGNSLVDQALAYGVPLAAIQLANGPQDVAKLIADYAKPENLRANGALIGRDQNGNPKVLYRSPALAAGQTLDAAGNAIDVPGAQEGLNTEALRPHLATKSLTAQTTVSPSGQPGIVPGQSELTALFPQGVPGNWAGIPGTRPPYAIPQSQTATAQPAVAQQLAPQKFIPTGQSPEQRTSSEDLGKLAESIRAGAESANEERGVSQQLAGYGKNINFGATAPWRLDLGKLAYDIPVIGSSVANMAVPNADVQIPAMQAYNKLAFGLVAKQTRNLGPREAVQAMQMVQSANPSIALTAGGNAALLHQINGTATYKEDMAKFADDWVKDPAHNNSLAGFTRWMNENHPYSSYVPALSDLQLALQGKDPKQFSVPDVPSQYGSQSATQNPGGKGSVPDGTRGTYKGSPVIMRNGQWQYQ